MFAPDHHNPHGRLKAVIIAGLVIIAVLLAAYWLRDSRTREVERRADAAPVVVSVG